MTSTGRIVEVSTVAIGDVLDGDHASGATVLTMNSVVDFDEEGGTLAYLDPSDDTTIVTIGYSATDPDAETITLSSALADDLDSDTFIAAYPESDEKVALVILDDEDDPLSARVPHSLYDRLTEGVRDPGEQEAVEVGLDSGDEWVVVDLLGTIPSIDGSYLTPGTVPAFEVVDAPAVSPAIDSVVGTTTSLVVAVGDIEPGTSIEYHITETSGYTPTPGDPTTLVADTASQVAVLDHLADASPLQLGVAYFVTVYAHNAIGYAPAPSSEVTGLLNLDNVETLVTAKLVAGFILSGRIDVGQISIDADDGITIVGPGGASLLHFPSNGTDDLEMTARLTATLLNVQNNLSISGSGQLYGDLNLNNGISTPTVQPSLGKYYPSILPTILGDGSFDVTGFNSGFIEKPGSTTDLATVSIFFGSNVRFVKKSDGSYQGDLTLGSWNTQFYGWGGLCYVPTPPSGAASYYILGSDNNRSGDVYIYRINASTGAKIGEVRIGSLDRVRRLPPAPRERRHFRRHRVDILDPDPHASVVHRRHARAIRHRYPPREPPDPRQRERCSLREHRHRLGPPLRVREGRERLSPRHVLQPRIVVRARHLPRLRPREHLPRPRLRHDGRAVPRLRHTRRDVVPRQVCDR